MSHHSPYSTRLTRSSCLTRLVTIILISASVRAASSNPFPGTHLFPIPILEGWTTAPPGVDLSGVKSSKPIIQLPLSDKSQTSTTPVGYWPKQVPHPTAPRHTMHGIRRTRTAEARTPGLVDMAIHLCVSEKCLGFAPGNADSPSHILSCCRKEASISLIPTICCSLMRYTLRKGSISCESAQLLSTAAVSSHRACSQLGRQTSRAL